MQRLEWTNTHGLPIACWGVVSNMPLFIDILLKQESAAPVREKDKDDYNAIKIILANLTMGRLACILQVIGTIRNRDFSGK